MLWKKREPEKPKPIIAHFKCLQCGCEAHYEIPADELLLERLHDCGDEYTGRFVVVGVRNNDKA